jgi:hypothetical protein
MAEKCEKVFEIIEKRSKKWYYISGKIVSQRNF